MQIIADDALAAHFQNVGGNIAESSPLQHTDNRQHIRVPAQEAIRSLQIGDEVPFGHIVAAVAQRGGLHFGIGDGGKAQVCVDRLHGSCAPATDGNGLFFGHGI